MDLPTALPILKALSLPEAVLQADHICSLANAHTLDSCPLGATAVYTHFDAALDTPEDLNRRLASDRSHFKRTL
jgi:hypothetical protein